MIIYFADRKLNVLGHASTHLPVGLKVIKDKKIDDIETGVATFECEVPYNDDTRESVVKCTELGNHILYSNESETEFFTIIDAEIDTHKKTVYIYAEDDGMDLLNVIVGEYEADKAYSIAYYIEKFAKGTGFEIGTNEAKDLTRKLSWDGEQTATARIASVATQFDGCEVSYSFEVEGLEVTRKFINIYKQRGKDVGATLWLNKDIDSIVTTKSIGNLATALQCTGGTPDNAENPITLQGYKYDDGDFYVDGKVLKSRNALKQWARYLWKDDDEYLSGGHIVKLYSYDTTNQKTLCSHAITELKKLREMEVNYSVDIRKLPDNVRIGDRINIVDEKGELYLSARVLQLKTSVEQKEYQATIGEYLIKSSGISQKVADLAAQFATMAKSSARALMLANNASTAAAEAQAMADAIAAEAIAAREKAEAAEEAAKTAANSAANAQETANNAQSAVDNVEKSVTSLETTVNNAQAAAGNAQQAASTAQSKADEAATAAAKAKADAADAKAAVEVAQTTANNATTKATTAQQTAETAKSEATTAKETADAAKLDAKKANDEIAALGGQLETVTDTMQAEYARKTDLTDAKASLQTQISRNAAGITSTASKMQIIDETANEAQKQLQGAIKWAEIARTMADEAEAEAQASQSAADAAEAAAQAAQAQADTARAAADTAKSVADQAEADLKAAKADLATVTSRADATEAEIAAAQEAVNTAQAAAELANADAEAAIAVANEAQIAADTAVADAAVALSVANDAAVQAALAQQAAAQAEGDKEEAERIAQEAAEAAAGAYSTAETALADATAAQQTANEAKASANSAEQAALNAAAQSAQAASDLAAAQQNLADIMERVDATEEEVAAAEAAVATAQAAAARANAEAEAAQATADAARADADAAQLAADNAREEAGKAQKAAEEAELKANEAQLAVYGLAVRTTMAETQIKQTSDALELKASKTELANYVDGSNERIAEIEKHFIFSTDGMEIKAENSDYSVVIDNDEISIKDKGNPVQTFDAKGNAHIPSLVVGQQFNLFGLVINATTDAAGKVTHISGEFVGG